jgi:hypothetical protein
MGFIAPALALTTTTAAGGTALTALGTTALVGGTTAATMAYQDDQSRKARHGAEDIARAESDKLSAIGPAPDSGGNPLDSLKRRKKTSSRSDTVQAGSLVPSSVGYKTLLG